MCICTCLAQCLHVYCMLFSLFFIYFVLFCFVCFCFIVFYFVLLLRCLFYSFLFLLNYFYSSPSLPSFWFLPTTSQPSPHPLLQKDNIIRGKFIETVALRFCKLTRSRSPAGEPSWDHELGPLHVRNSCVAWSFWGTPVSETRIYPWCMICGFGLDILWWDTLFSLNTGERGLFLPQLHVPVSFLRIGQEGLDSDTRQN